MKTVWVVSSGEIDEGGDIIGVFKRKPSDAFMYDRLQWEWEKVHDDRWVSGRDFLIRERFKVQ